MYVLQLMLTTSEKLRCKRTEKIPNLKLQTFHSINYTKILEDSSTFRYTKSVYTESILQDEWNERLNRDGNISDDHTFIELRMSYLCFSIIIEGVSG